MGRDKVFVEIDGEPMVRRVVRAASEAGASRVVTVGGDAARLAAVLADLDVPVGHVPDAVAGEGPLVAIVTALGALDTDIVLVVACDLLAPSPTAMASTVAALAEHPDCDLASPSRDEQVEWLHAAWRPAARRALAACVAKGMRSVHGAVDIAGLRLVTVTNVDAAGLADADTPTDLDPRQ